MSINPDPYSRISPKLRGILQKKDVFFDVHCHIFTSKDVPDGFLGIRVPFDQRFLKFLEHQLHKIISKSDTDKLSNLAYFIEFFRSRSSEETAEKLMGYYPVKNFVFCPLMMDMAPGIKGKIERDYDEQIEKMKSVRDEFPNTILPFFAADPNNPKVLQNFLKVFSDKEDYKFFGVKIYPSLGYLPSHPELMNIYSLCEKNKIPVTAHCAGASVHSSKKTIKDISGFHYVPGQGFVEKTITKSFKRKKDYANFFNHPRNWIPVLEKYPNLKLNLAHFGGDNEWKDFLSGKTDTWVETIMDLMGKHPNLYSDFSYTMYHPGIAKKLKSMVMENDLLASQLLYGSDYYMIVREGHFKAMKNNFIELMGEDIMKKVAFENPKRFLFGS
ncbi:MAG: amidohydrolase family protein [Bacteroidales bacterium]|nr:amidohydrolase family protein [Bacteroidales bacterium]MCF8391793.1 amidohydrolase family protein [Bacteroidales bacterium]